MHKFIFLFSVVLCHPFSIFSQTSTSTGLAVQTDTLKEALIITHSKIPISQKSEYKPTIVISNDDILRHTNDDISTLLDRSIGLSVNSSASNPGKDKSLFLQGSSGEFTLILIDGIPVTDPSGIGGTFDLRSMSLSEIDRIEIVKGGQSVLYGSDAIAGVVNLITKSTQVEKATGRLKTSYGSFKSPDISGSVQIPINNSFQVNIGGAHSSSEGVSEALDSQNLGFDKDGFSKNAVHTSLKIQPSKSLGILPFIRFSSFNGDYDGGAFTDGPDTYESTWIQSGLTSTFRLKKTDINLSYTYNKTNRTFNSAFGIFIFNGRFNNLDLLAHAKLGSKSSIILGLNHQQLRMNVDNNQVEDPNAQLLSPYVSYNLQPDEKSIFELGLRYNRHSNYGSNISTSVGGSRWLSPQVKLSASYATSFKAPNLFQLYGQFGANLQLQPQIGRSFNLGLTTSDLGLLEEITLSFFDRTVDDLIIYDFATGYNNIPKQHDQGFELLVKSSIGPLNLSASYTYLFGELDDKSGNAPIENLLRRPKHQIDLALSYRYAGNSRIQLNLKHSGMRDDIYFDNVTFLNEAITLDSYVVGDFYVNYEINSKTVLFGEVKNAFDTDFQEVAGFTSLGRNYRIGFSISL